MKGADACGLDMLWAVIGRKPELTSNGRGWLGLEEDYIRSGSGSRSRNASKAVRTYSIAGKSPKQPNIEQEEKQSPL